MNVDVHTLSGAYALDALSPEQVEALLRTHPDVVDAVVTATPNPLAGNLLLSRLPVRQAYRHLLPWPADADHADMQRIAIGLGIHGHGADAGQRGDALDVSAEPAVAGRRDLAGAVGLGAHLHDLRAGLEPRHPDQLAARRRRVR